MMNEKQSEVIRQTIDSLTEKFETAIVDVYQSTGDTFILVSAEQLLPIVNFLKEELDYTFLSDVFGIDRYTSDDRFEVVDNLISLKNRARIFLKVRWNEENPEVASVVSVWKSANWNEREVYDMFGIRFKNHPDRRRMYMPEDFESFPLRKEFPLLGVPGSIELPSTTPDREE